jgi:hypothetical protein
MLTVAGVIVKVGGGFTTMVVEEFALHGATPTE